MMPELQSATEHTSQKLQMLVSKMKQPVPEIYSVVNTFAADEDRYFNCMESEKWRRKLVKL